MVWMKTTKEQVKGTGGYRLETEMSGKRLRRRPGPTQRSRPNDNDDDDNDEDDDDDDMWRKVKT